MATAGETNTNQMERLTTCPICLDKFRTPKLLPCMHTFCLTPCLTNLVDPRARSLKCPECRREHQIPGGGVQFFPANLTMIGFLDLQPGAMINERVDRCAICKQQKPTLVKCHDCSKFMCTDCREPHLRETFNQISSSVSQLRRSLPGLSEKIASYEQRVHAVRTNDEQIRREIVVAIASLIEELKHRETALFTEAEVYMQSQLRMFRLNQEAAEVELASVASFCESVGTSLPSGQFVNDADLANMRSQCHRYAQQIDALQVQIPTDVQKLRLTFDNQAAISSAIQNFGRLIDVTREQQHSHLSASQVFQLQHHQQQQQQQQHHSPQQARLSMAQYSHSAMPYVPPSTSPRYTPSSQNDQYRHLENLYYSRGLTATQPSVSLSQTIGYRPTLRHLSDSINSPFADLSQTVPARTLNPPYATAWNTPTPNRSVSNEQSVSIFGPNPFAANNPQPPPVRPPVPPPPEPSPRRTYATSTTAGRSLEGDDRPIFGGRGGAPGGGTLAPVGRGRGRAAAPIQEYQPPANALQRRGTFVLDEPTLPNLPQSGAQRARDPVVVRDLYNVRRRNRAQTPVAFTINLNEIPQPADATAASGGTG